jgi:hypothetical protein
MAAARWFIADAPPEQRAYHEIPVGPVEPPVTPPTGDLTAADCVAFVKVLRSIFG